LDRDKVAYKKKEKRKKRGPEAEKALYRVESVGPGPAGKSSNTSKTAHLAVVIKKLKVFLLFCLHRVKHFPDEFDRGNFILNGAA
jgi:hypothetical protein